MQNCKLTDNILIEGMMFQFWDIGLSFCFRKCIIKNGLNLPIF